MNKRDLDALIRTRQFVFAAARRNDRVSLVRLIHYISELPYDECYKLADELYENIRMIGDCDNGRNNLRD